jgi:two-component system chemotaxis sensor kinase CheA
MSDVSGVSGEYARFRATFFEECTEILADLEAHLTRVQTEALDAESLNAVFRAAHSIKAGAGVFGFAELVRFTHAFEALLDRMRSGAIPQSDRVSQILIRGGDVLSALVSAAQEDRPPHPDFGADVLEDIEAVLGTETSAGSAAHEVASASASNDAAAAAAWSIAFTPNPDLFRNATEPALLIRELKRLGNLTVTCDVTRLPDLAVMDPEQAYLAWNFRLVTDRPRSDILEVFEFVDDRAVVTVEREDGTATDMQHSGPSAAQEQEPERLRSTVPSAQSGTQPKANAASSIRVELARVDRLVNMVGELVITQAMLAQEIADRDRGQGRHSIRGHEDLAALTRELQECVMAIRMQPVKSVFARMPRLVREVSSKLSKKVQLITSGEQTEVDKTVIEELADPLTHMIRNSVDHGIELPEVRRAAGKPEEGTIELSAAHVGGNIVIQITDDGAGINRPRLLEKAIEKGIVPPNASLADEEIDDLIFAPGFSTAATVTDISGRGVGMDVVRRNIVNLGGRIQVQTTPGRGTRFTLVIPLTLAVLDGMVVAVGQERYILPLTSILESFRPAKAAVRSLASGTEVVSIRGEFVRLVRLDRVFNVEGAVAEPWNGLIVMVETASGQRVGMTVDELLGQQQVVIKSLADNFDPVQGISGATILGNGRVALILDVEQLAPLNAPSSGPRTLSLPQTERLAISA